MTEKSNGLRLARHRALDDLALALVPLRCEYVGLTVPLMHVTDTTASGRQMMICVHEEEYGDGVSFMAGGGELCEHLGGVHQLHEVAAVIRGRLGAGRVP